MSRPIVSILIVSFNAGSLLTRCLSSIVDTPGAEVIIVDNASTDATIGQIELQYPRVRMQRQRTNSGFASGVNCAASLASSDLLLVLNPDTELPPNGVSKMITSIQEHPRASVMGFRQVDASNRFQPTAHGLPTLWREFGRRFVQRHVDQGRDFVPHLVDRYSNRLKAVSWVSGSAMLMRREIFDRVGGFDERFFLYFEDVDFCLRVNQADGCVFYDPSTTLVHHRGASAATSAYNINEIYRQSQLLFSAKHHHAFSRWVVETYLRCRGEHPSSTIRNAHRS